MIDMSIFWSVNTKVLLISSLFLALTACNNDENNANSNHDTSTNTPQLEGSKFRVTPYIQNPSSDAMTVIWFSENKVAGELTVDGVGTFKSQPEEAKNLYYSEGEIEYIHGATNYGKLHIGTPAGQAPVLPYKHLIRVTGLSANKRYSYSVRQGTDKVFTSQFKTSPQFGARQAVSFVVMSDMETEPNSTQSFVSWGANAIQINGWKLLTDPATVNRLYPLDQTSGYKQTLNYATKMKPDLWLIAGDLVERGGRQIDWDEFWRHASGEWGTLASSAVIVPALGNHENYWHPTEKSYSPASVMRAYDKWSSYWDLPKNDASEERYNKRFYRMDYGPVTIITLDSSNGNDSDASQDTNLHIDGRASKVPDFNPGSEQWNWAVKQLAEAQSKGQIIFVQWHHNAYGTGVHSMASGNDAQEDSQSGIPMRVYHTLMKQYGVVAVFSGHDELLETVELDGIHYWDVGISGDGLRGPGSGDYVPFELLPKQAQNTHWSAHGDSQEVWRDKKLVSGGKHYGFVHVEVKPTTNNRFDIIIQPKYSLPLMDTNGNLTGKFEELNYEKTIHVNKAF